MLNKKILDLAKDGYTITFTEFLEAVDITISRDENGKEYSKDWLVTDKFFLEEAQLLRIIDDLKEEVIKKIQLDAVRK